MRRPEKFGRIEAARRPSTRRLRTSTLDHRPTTSALPLPTSAISQASRSNATDRTGPQPVTAQRCTCAPACLLPATRTAQGRCAILSIRSCCLRTCGVNLAVGLATSCSAGVRKGFVAPSLSPLGPQDRRLQSSTPTHIRIMQERAATIDNTDATGTMESWTRSTSADGGGPQRSALSASGVSRITLAHPASVPRALGTRTESGAAGQNGGLGRAWELGGCAAAATEEDGSSGAGGGLDAEVSRGVRARCFGCRLDLTSPLARRKPAVSESEG